MAKSGRFGSLAAFAPLDLEITGPGWRVQASEARLRAFLEHVQKRSPLLSGSRFPEPVRRADWFFILAQLYVCWCEETFEVYPTARPPLRRTVKQLRTMAQMVWDLSNDPNLPYTYNVQLSRVATKAMATAEALDHQRDSGHGGRPRETGRLNKALKSICEEVRRAAGKPNYAIILRFLKVVLPDTFPASTKIQHLTSRIRD